MLDIEVIKGEATFNAEDVDVVEVVVSLARLKIIPKRNVVPAEVMNI